MATARSWIRWLALGLTAALAGCAAGPPGVFVPTLSPREEALAYFPVGAPLVALVRTDPGNEQWRWLADSGLLDPAIALADARGLRPAQVRTLLGRSAAVGIPVLGSGPLAVLPTRDAEALAILARARVLAGRAAPAGSYRGASLYAERAGGAFATRGPVLLVARDTAALRAALDTRVGPSGLEPGDLARDLPRGEGLVRAVGDLRPLIARLPGAIRAAPVLRAVDRAGIHVRVTPAAVRAEMRAPVAGAGLAPADVPPARGGLAGTLRWADRVLAEVRPLTRLRLETRLRRARVVPERDLLPHLTGPAWVVLGRPGGPRLVAPLARTRAVARVVTRAARRLDLERSGPLVTVRDRGGTPVVRFGVLGRALVVGRGSARSLHALARTRARAGDGPVALRLPAGLLPGLPAASIWLDGDVQVLTARLRARLPRP